MLTDEGLIMKHKIHNINNKNELGLSKKIWVQVISSFKIQLLFKIKTVVRIKRIMNQIKNKQRKYDSKEAS